MIMTYSLLFLIAVMLFGIFKLVKFGESQQDTRACPQFNLA
ncbi:Uncharacterised protein [Neisseria meningitidis]|nr:Uncharacterised protein [Neisseria meningitidis]CWS24342.1 Uncharacterised protein [Neisseria meningitidis]